MRFLRDWGFLDILAMVVRDGTAVPIPAEIVIPPAAYWAAQGKLNIAGVVLAATAGGWVGPALSYWIASRLGRPRGARYGRYRLMAPNEMERADRWFESACSGGRFLA